MKEKELDSLIRFHQSGLEQYRQYISPAAQYLEKQTIEALSELKKVYNTFSAVKAILEDIRLRHGRSSFHDSRVHTDASTAIEEIDKVRGENAKR